MTILALEFSSERRSVAVARDGIVLAEAFEQGGGRATNAFGMIGKVLAGANISREEIEGIAVGLGPGSYTGIRAAIALAQGWQLARGIKLCGAGSAAALAVEAQAEKFFGKVNVVIDAQRNEFYVSTWMISAARCEEISPLSIVSALEIEQRRAAGEQCVGPETGVILFPQAAGIARLAAAENSFATGGSLEPVYLRATNFVKAAPAKLF